MASGLLNLGALGPRSVPWGSVLDRVDAGATTLADEIETIDESGPGSRPGEDSEPGRGLRQHKLKSLLLQLHVSEQS